MKNKLKLLPLSVAVLFTPAYAERNTYIGVSAGQISSDFCDDAISSVTCEDEGLGFRGFAGRQFSKTFATEIGYTHAPKVADVSGEDAGGENVDFESKYSAFDIGAVVRYPFSDTFTLSAYAGSAFWKVKSKGEGAEESDDGTDIRYGFGVEITPAKFFSVRGEWTRVDVDGDNLDYISLSAAYRF